MARPCCCRRTCSSEVEAVCDRVAMLRKGRLIEVGDLASMRGLAAIRVEAELVRRRSRPGCGAGRGRRRGGGPEPALHGGRADRPAARGARAVRGATAADARTVARRALRRSLWGRRLVNGGGRAVSDTATTIVPPRRARSRRRRPRCGRAPDRAIARSVFGRVWKGALALGVTFGVVAASSAKTYVSSFPTEASRHSMAATLLGQHQLLDPVRVRGAHRDGRRVHLLQVVRLPDDHRCDLGDPDHDPDTCAARRSRGGGTCCSPAGRTRRGPPRQRSPASWPRRWWSSCSPRCWSQRWGPRTRSA